MPPVSRRPSVTPPVVSATPKVSDKYLKSRWSDQSLDPPELEPKKSRSIGYRATSNLSMRSNHSLKTDPKKDQVIATGTPIINISSVNDNKRQSDKKRATDPADTADSSALADDAELVNALADELDFVTVENVSALSVTSRQDKASRVLGIRHRKSMEPIPASARNSIVSTRSVRDPPPTPSFTPTLPLTSLYVVSGLPKSPHTWTLADPDSVMGLHHTEAAVSRWWRPEVLGSTVSPGCGGGKRKKKGKGEGEIMKGAGALSKQEVGKMLSKALKLSFTREVEVIASTLQPASTIHTFTFTLPAPNTPLAPSLSGDLLRASVLTNSDNRTSAATFAYPYSDDPFVRPSSAYLGPSSLLGHASGSGGPSGPGGINGATGPAANSNTVTYHGVCLTVWSHADAERSSAIRRTLEAGRSRKESAQSAAASRLKSLRADVAGASNGPDPRSQARRSAKRGAKGPWATDGETDGETEGEGAMSESDFEVSTIGHGPGESTLFLPGDTVFWLPYALTLVSRHPIYDLMRDYLTLSWARFSKDVQSHTLQISKILAHPAPRAGDLIKLDASAKSDGGETNLEVIARFPGGLDFGRGLVDINFTMWPLFKCLNIDNILTICEIALAPTGRVLFFSRHPAMLGIAVSTIKYLVELRGWSGIALSAVHSRDAKIYIDDPGPWIMGLATEARYSIRPGPEVCVCDLDINYLNCSTPPVGVVSTKQQREKYRQRLLLAFEPHYHPDHSVPSEFKEAFPAGRFRPVCKIQAKRGASSAAVADTIKPPEWWHSTRIIQAFDAVLQRKFKKPTLFKRISRLGAAKRPPQLTTAEQLIQLSIRKRATAFVDARDDLETKIGRLSRRLNFLMTESDLWRDKFVTFEQYAEKLSAEANQLRAKINKEQRETKRLSGLVTLTAAEKSRLQNQLKDTETAHKDAVVELEQMRDTMERMELERAEMVAEVEAQIERALQSMAVEIDDSDYSDSRPGSSMSNHSGMSGGRTRKISEVTMRPLRSFPTESTLAESYGEGRDDTLVSKIERHTETIEEDEEEDRPASPSKKKRFSATRDDLPQDGMTAVDEGISQKSDKIAKKVLEIQQKLETALATERRTKPRSRNVTDSEADLSETTVIRPRPARSIRHGQKVQARHRNRSETTSSSMSSESNRPVDVDENVSTSSPKVPPPHSLVTIPSEPGIETPTRAPPSSGDEQPSVESKVIRKISSGASLTAMSPFTPSEMTPTTPALTPAMTGTTDDSDTDFQSAYSASPRESYGEFDEDGRVKDTDVSVIEADHNQNDFGTSPPPQYAKTFQRASHVPKTASRSSTATTGSSTTTAVSIASPTFSEDTVTSTPRATLAEVSQ